MNQSGVKASIEETPVNTAGIDLALLRSKWTWCAKLGIVLIILGIVAIGMTAVSETNSVLWLSWLIVLSGIAETTHAFQLRRTGAFFFHLVPGIAGIPLGLLVATHPAVGMIAWMLVFACIFTIVGVFRMVSALHLKFPGWPWAVIDSAVMLVIGSVFWTTWTWLGPRFFDIAVGVTLILRGWSSVMLGLGLRRRHAPTHSSSSGPRHRPAQPYTVKATDIS